MKRVSIEKAVALKEAGYPQDGLEPFYLEVWLWLWRVKGIDVWADYDFFDDKWYAMYDSESLGAMKNSDEIATDDPEDAIIAAIDYLIDNALIRNLK